MLLVEASKETKNFWVIVVWKTCHRPTPNAKAEILPK